MRRISTAAIAAGAVMLIVGLGPAPSGAEVAEAPILYQAWYFRAKPESPVVQSPQGPVSAGPEFPPAPQSVEGGYTVSFAGGSPGEENGDTGWAAFQYDVSAAQGGSVEQFIATFTQDPANRGDFGTPLLRGCPIVTPWAAPPTANPWNLKPFPDCSTAVQPEVGTGEGGRRTFTFDFTAIAKEQLDDRAFGMMILPGFAPDGAPPPYAPFQLTLAGYNQPPEELNLAPKVTFRFTPGADSFIGGGATESFGVSDLSVGSDVATGELAPAPNIDVIPTDVGSTPDAVAAAPSAAPPEVALPSQRGGARTRTVSTSKGGVPAAMWLLLPLAGLIFWGTGTALGPAGEPRLPRQGGVSRVLSMRRSAASNTQTEA